jgi:hypothetical protein
MASKRGNPVARAGNYAQEIDSTGVDQEMKNTVFGTPMTKAEKGYVSGVGNRPSATEAVRRARKANKQPPLRSDE